MIDINEATSQLTDELVEYLQDAPVDISTLLHHDLLYELCYDEVISRLVEEQEAREDAKKYEEYDNESKT